MKGFLVVISGPSSGGGKDSVTRGVAKKGNFFRVITYTTRERRPGEKEGGDLHFISRREFLRKEKEGFFLETNRLATEKEGNFYGSPKKEKLNALFQNKDVLLRVDVNGARAVKKQLPDALAIFIYAPIPEMRRRLIKRGRDSREDIEKKLALAKQEMKEKDKGYFDYRILNREGKLEETIEQILEIIKKEKKV